MANILRCPPNDGIKNYLYCPGAVIIIVEPPPPPPHVIGGGSKGKKRKPKKKRGRDLTKRDKQILSDDADLLDLTIELIKSGIIE
jgi:hypothetical protein